MVNCPLLAIVIKSDNSKTKVGQRCYTLNRLMKTFSNLNIKRRQLGHLLWQFKYHQKEKQLKIYSSNFDIPIYIYVIFGHLSNIFYIYYIYFIENVIAIEHMNFVNLMVIYPRASCCPRVISYLLFQPSCKLFFHIFLWFYFHLLHVIGQFGCRQVWINSKFKTSINKQIKIIACNYTKNEINKYQQEHETNVEIAFSRWNVWDKNENK